LNQPIIIELQQQALDPSQSVTVLLRKALLVATKLDLTDAIDWIEKELSGWQADDLQSIPTWRTVSGQVVARNPFRGWEPVTFEGIDAGKMLAALSIRPITQPAAEIEAWVTNKNSGTLQITYPADLEHLAHECMNFADLPIRCQVSVFALKPYAFASGEINML
jgi:hypothetical protein